MVVDTLDKTARFHGSFALQLHYTFVYMYLMRGVKKKNKRPATARAEVERQQEES